PAGRACGVRTPAGGATPRAEARAPTGLGEGAGRLADLVERTRPRVVAVAGIPAYRSAFGRPRARPGRQPEPLGPADLWVVPNPSGLNAHETTASLAAAYAAPARAAGVLPGP